MDLVFLIPVVVEDFSNQRTPHQLRVSVFDLKQERRGDQDSYPAVQNSSD